MKTKELIKISMATLVAAVLSSCVSTGADSGPRYVSNPNGNGNGGGVPAPRWL